MNESWRRILTANIIGNLDDMLDNGLITQARYDRAVAILEADDEPDDWYEHPRAWEPQPEAELAEQDVPF